MSKDKQVRLTITEAVKYAKELGIDMSRPTIIKYASQCKYGYQIGGYNGKWVILKTAFRRFICGQNNQSKKVGSGSNKE